MTIYRNHYSTEGGISGGFSYHPSKRDAKLAVKGWKTSDAPPHEIAEPLTLKPTRYDIIRFLNQHGAHPDNG